MLKRGDLVMLTPEVARSVFDLPASDSEAVKLSRAIGLGIVQEVEDRMNPNGDANVLITVRWIDHETTQKLYSYQLIKATDLLNKYKDTPK
jgi:hypothetical protein